MTRVLRERKTEAQKTQYRLQAPQTDRHKRTCIHRVTHPDKGIQSHGYTHLRDQIHTDSRSVNTS